MPIVWSLSDQTCPRKATNSHISRRQSQQYDINYQSGTYNQVTDSVTIVFDNAADKIALYPFVGCKSNPSPAPAATINTSGITFNAAPNSATITLSFDQAARANAAIYSQSLAGVVRTDTLQFCIYAATTANGNSAKEVGFTEVKVSLTFSADGNLLNVNIVDADTQEGTTVAATDDFQGLFAKTCDGATTLTQVCRKGRLPNL